MEILEPFPGEDRCVVICDPDPGPNLKIPRLKLDSRIHLDTRDIELADLGAFLASFCEEEVLIPARSASKVIGLQEKDTTLGAMLEKVGLVVGPPATGA